MEDLLKSPCKCCGYNGRGYWQAGTHNPTCPFHNIGGRAEREEFVSKYFGEVMYHWYKSWRHNNGK